MLTNTVSVGGALTVNEATFSTARGALSNANILYTTPSTLSLTSGISFVDPSGSTFQPTAGVVTAGVGNLTFTGTLQLAGNDTFTGDVITINSAAAVTGLTSTWNMVVNAAGTSTISSNITTNIGNFTSGGAGTLTLSGTNAYTGNTIISAGVLAISGDSNLGTPPGAATANSIQLGTATLQSSGTYTLNSFRGITLTGTGTLQSASGTLTYGGKIDGAHALTLLGTGSLILNGDIGSATLLTTITANANLASLTINNTTVHTSSTQTYNGPLILSNSGTQTFTSGSTLTLTGATWTGTNAIDLTSSAGIVLNGPMNGVSGSLNLTAGALASTITTGANSSVLVANFNLIQGTWSQVTASLPGFTVTNNFQIASGGLPSSAALFLRATGGAGTSGSPYLITDVYGLQGIGSTSTTLTESYSLANNINAAGTSTWNSGAGFLEFIGPLPGFSGTFNGQNFVISGLYENNSSQTGLFGFADGATISNVGLINVNLTGTANAGALVADLYANDTVTNCYSTGTVTVNGANAQVGGLIGISDNQGANTISNVYSTANVSAGAGGSGISYVGGLIGRSDWPITNAYATGTVNGGTGTAGGTLGATGGLIGYAGDTITNSYATGAVSMNESAYTGSGGYIGGLVGFATNNITTSYATGTVTGTGGGTGIKGEGGLVGILTGGTVLNSYATGAVSGTLNSGGLVGELQGTAISNSYATGATSGIATGTGGLVGLGSGSITSSFWDTAISGQTAVQGTSSTASLTNVTGGCFLGGACTNGGTANMSASATYSSAPYSWSIGNTTGSTWVIQSTNGLTRPMLSMEYSTSIVNAHQLQLIGLNSTTLNATYTLSNVINGSATSTITDVWGSAGFSPIGTSTTPFTGSISGAYLVNNIYINLPSGTNVGLFGDVSSTGHLSTIGVSGTINGLTNVGGLVGTNAGVLTNVYSVAAVTTGNGSSNVGGLVGVNSATGSITNGYSAGVVTVGSSSNVGGFVGNNSGTFTSDYWDSQVSTKSTGVGTGTSTNVNSETTANMKLQATFVGWDFVNTWAIFRPSLIRFLVRVMRM